MDRMPSSHTRKKRLGGKLLAQGLYGCVFNPPLYCSNGTKATDNKVSKLMRMNNAISEFATAKKIIHKIPDINEYSKYFILPDTKCASRTDQTNTNVKKCLDDMETMLGKPPVELLRSPVLLGMNVGGIDLKKFIDTYNQTRIPITFGNTVQFIKFFRDLIKCTEVLQDKFIIHNDLHSKNVMVGMDGVPRIIDFGRTFHVGSELDIVDTINNYYRLFNADISGKFLQFSPEFIMLCEVLHNPSENQQTTIDAVMKNEILGTDDNHKIHRKLHKAYMEFVHNIIRPATMRTGRISKSSLIRNWIREYWIKQDVWAIGMIVRDIIINTQIWRDFNRSTGQDIVDKFSRIISKMTDPDPATRIDSKDALRRIDSLLKKSQESHAVPPQSARSTQSAGYQRPHTPCCLRRTRRKNTVR